MDINDFKSSNIFKLYEPWITSLITDDYYCPDTFDEEGDLPLESSFREEEFEQAKDKILDVSHYIYKIIANGHIFGSYFAGSIAYGVSDSLSVFIHLLDKHEDCNHVALAGTIYFMLVYDYPNYRPILGNKTIKIRAYNDLFTRFFVKIGNIQEWLNLYALLRDFTSVLDLPPSMQSEIALKFLRNLQGKGFLDNNYRLTPPIRGEAFRKLIVENLALKACCPYRELEEHFKVKNLRDRRTLEALENRINNPNERKITKEEITYNAIKSCFTKT